MSLSSRFRATVARLVARSGRQENVTVVRYVSTSGGEIEDSFEARATFLPASQGSVEAFDFGSYKGAYAHRRRCFMVMPTATATFTPRMGDEVQVGDQVWIAGGCTPTQLDGETPVMFGVGLVEQ